jgi:hypothetical protein
MVDYLATQVDACHVILEVLYQEATDAHPAGKLAIPAPNGFHSGRCKECSQCLGSENVSKIW